MALFVAYWAVANTLLASDWVRNGVSSASGVHFEYTSAWTVWPGRVHVAGVHLRIEDYNMQTELEIGEADVDVVLSELATRTFRASRVEASRVSFRFRHKLDGGHDNRARLAAYPPIEGFSAPIRRGKPPPPADPESDVWSVAIDSASVGVHELWVQEFRFSGEASAHGGFFLEPGLKLELLESVLSFERGETTSAEKLVARGPRGHLRARLARQDIRTMSWTDLVRRLELGLKLDQRIESLSFLELYYGESFGKLSGGQGPLHIALRTVDRALAPDSVVTYETTTIALRRDQTEWRAGGIEAALRVEANGSRALSIDVRAKSVIGRAAPRGSEPASEPFAKADSVSVRLADKDASMLTAFSPAEAVFEVGELAVTDPRGLARALGAGRNLPIRGGSVTASGRVQYRHGHEVRGSLAVSLNGLRFASGASSLSLHGTGKARFRRTDGDAVAHVDPLELHLDRITLGDGKERAALWAHLVSERTSVQSFDPLAFDSELRIGAASLKPLYELWAPGVLEFVSGPFLDFDTTHGRVQVIRAEDRTEVRLVRLKSGNVHVHGSWIEERVRERGAFLVALGPVNVGVRLGPAGASVVPLVSDDWLRSQ
jgi:hypothetical protein